jgi:hypothetical protein
MISNAAIKRDLLIKILFQCAGRGLMTANGSEAGIAAAQTAVPAKHVAAPAAGYPCPAIDSCGQSSETKQ